MFAGKSAEPGDEVFAGCVLGPGKQEEKGSPLSNASPHAQQVAQLWEAPVADALGL